MSTLALSVWLEREGELVCFTAGSTPPAWAEALITNPLAWVEAGVPVEPELVEVQLTTGNTPDEPGVVNLDLHEAANAVLDIKIPPVKGKGSGAAAWAAYAKAHGFDVEEDAKASEIREALAEAGVPVE